MLNFKTKPDVNGNTYYLVIDTKLKQFSTTYGLMIETAAVIKKRDIKSITEELKKDGFIQVNYN